MEASRAKLIETLKALSWVNDPFSGLITPKDFEDSFLWPGEKWDSIEESAQASADGRQVAEYRFMGPKGPKPFLPVAFVVDPAASNGPTAYVYSDHHLVDDRGPILTPVEGIKPWRSEDDVLYRYFQALNGNRLEEVLSIFDEDGYFQHSNAETFRGRDELRTDFVKMMGETGIRIQYCRFTDDGKTCVVECYMPSGRPAIAVYERGNTGGLHAVRIYL
ncbi:nuclear transport factor 2 family protein [Rhizobium sp. L1K21]|uniref:nuclear transport factor 2 family protein n=1 Tax=Rhizobium sp. L1K21 TaxID=2954933 RepID=UPI002093A2E9|nr:nuclear transport factor 2 family protein [Rhizobium sp. L1K21]MCO6187597.1 nuclear transport factor 2 family protein [Rhizobium sp. L1K21]